MIIVMVIKILAIKIFLIAYLLSDVHGNYNISSKFDNLC